MSEQNTEEQEIQSNPTPEISSEREQAKQAVLKSNPDWEKSGEQSKEASQTEAQGDKHEKTDPATAKQDNSDQKKGKSGFDRRISSLTKQLRETQERLAKYEQNQKPSEKVEKKFTRESFANDAEYLEYLAEEKAKKIIEDRLSQEAKQNREQVETFHNQAELQKEWKRQEAEVFKGNDEAYRHYQDLIEEHHDTVLPNEVWEVINHSKIRPMLLAVVLSNGDMLSELDEMSPYMRINHMIRLEERVSANLAKKTEQPKPAQTKAPAPVGNIGTQGGAVDEGNLSWQQLIERRKKERGLTR